MKYSEFLLVLHDQKRGLRLEWFGFNPSEHPWFVFGSLEKQGLFPEDEAPFWGAYIALRRYQLKALCLQTAEKAAYAARIANRRGDQQQAEFFLNQHLRYEGLVGSAGELGSSPHILDLWDVEEEGYLKGIEEVNRYLASA